MSMASPIPAPRRGLPTSPSTQSEPAQALLLPSKPLLSALLCPQPRLMPLWGLSMLYITSLASKTQGNVGEAAFPGPSCLVPSHRLVLPPAVRFPTVQPLGHWRALCTCLEPHLPNSGGRQLCVQEPRPGWAGLEQALGFSHDCCLLIAM